MKSDTEPFTDQKRNGFGLSTNGLLQVVVLIILVILLFKLG